MRTCFCLALALPVFAGQDDWAKVECLRFGQSVRVQCTGQRTWKGRVSKVSADALVLEVGRANRNAARAEILQIEVKSRAASALIGLGIGAAGGTGIGYAAGAGGGLKSGEAATAAALGAGLFAAAGAGLGSLFPGWKTVYRASGVPARLDP